jgi:hypothetical protein
MSTYSHGIVTFMDLLGFKEFVNREPDADKINKVLDTVQKFVHVDKEEQQILGLRSIAVSDSVVRFALVDDPSHLPAPNLQLELLGLIHIQGELANQGILVRGGVTHGAVFIDGIRCFGPAYQRAYQLESEVATYPRIVVDQCVIDDYIGYPEGRGDRTFGGAEEEIMELLRRDDARTWYLDYLGAMSTEVEDNSVYIDFLGRHRDLILKNMKDNVGKDSVLRKYDWLAEYHNSVVNLLKDTVLAVYGVAKKDLLVP